MNLSWQDMVVSWSERDRRLFCFGFGGQWGRSTVGVSLTVVSQKGQLGKNGGQWLCFYWCNMLYGLGLGGWCCGSGCLVDWIGAGCGLVV